MRVLLLIFLVILSMHSVAQRRYIPLDTTRTFFPVTYGSRVWKPMLALDAFRSYYSGSPIAFNGLRIGAEYHGTHRFGVGIYLLKKDVVFSGIHVDSPYATDTSLVKYKMKFMSLFYERVFYKTKRWEVSFPLYLGVGKRHGFVEDYQGNYPQYLERTFAVLNVGIGAKFFIFPWLAPKVGAGYRYTIVGETGFRKAFTGLYYSFGLSISGGELYRSFFKKDKKL